MPICGRCGIDQPEDAFSTESQPLCETCYEIEIEEEAAGGEIGNDTTTAAGVIAGNNGRQYEGSEKEDNEDEPASKPRKKVELSNAARILDQDGKILGEQQDQDPPDLALLEPLVKAVEERGYSAGFGLDSQEVLKYRLQRVLFDPDNAVITWLTRPLIPALIHGTPELLQKRVTPLNIQNKAVIEEQTLLHWLCQWKLLQLQCGWKGHDDIVDLLLRAGADPNATLANGCTPLFFSVKYATVDTLRLLIDGGANPNQKDNLRQTCLRNALPQASPYIIKFLLKYIPANETFQTETFDGSKLKINALDILVTEFVTPSPDISWANLGM